jgi:hypothetical protein
LNPFPNVSLVEEEEDRFSAVIYTQLSSPVVHLGAPIFKLVRNVAASKYVKQVKTI